MTRSDWRQALLGVNLGPHLLKRHERIDELGLCTKAGKQGVVNISSTMKPLTARVAWQQDALRTITTTMTRSATRIRSLQSRGPLNAPSRAERRQR